MEAIVALVVSGVFAYACADALKERPAPFYIAFALVGAIYACGILETMLPAAELALLPFLRRASLAFGLFSVVMFIGVLPQEHAARRRLAPVRGRLSLLAAILVVVHVSGYAGNYLAAASAGTLSGWPLAGLAIGAATAVLLIVLAATSIDKVHSAMAASRWARVQKLAYPFYLLMYAHLAAMLLPSSLLGGSSLANLLVYTSAVVLYAILRLRRACRCRI